MLMTKKYEYLNFDRILFHPDLPNHRPLDLSKVNHYESDILKNGLLEPLVVWEKKDGEYYLVGGFHRINAIRGIRKKNPGYFDHVDVRVVAGELDEIRALNLKLNADRLDTKITDYFDTVIYLINGNWDKERIASFLGKSTSWVEEIIRFVPGMNSQVRDLLQAGKISWAKAKSVCKKVKEAPAGSEQNVLAKELNLLSKDGNKEKPKRKPLTFRVAKKKLTDHLQNNPKTTYTIDTDTLLSLLLVLEGKHFEDAHLSQVRSTFPALMN